jgi:UTP pyrophosphatase
MRYLAAYPEAFQSQARQLLAQGNLGDYLRGRYPDAHGVRTDGALYDFAAELRSRYLRKGDALNKVMYDSKLHVVRNALGLHTTVARAQGAKLKARHEVRIASFFKRTPPEFLRMIVVHELAHFKEKAHDKAFYQLCAHMEPHYHQYEFDVRLYLTLQEATGESLW